MDLFEKLTWAPLQVILWVCTRSKPAVRACDDDRNTSEIIEEVLMPSGRVGRRWRSRRRPDISFEDAEVQVLDALSRGRLRASGLRQGEGDREGVPEQHWGDLQFYWSPPRKGFHHPSVPRSVYGSHRYVGPRDRLRPNATYWTGVLIEREEVLALWSDPQRHMAEGAGRKPGTIAASGGAKTRVCAPTIPPAPKRGPDRRYDWPLFHAVLDQLIRQEPDVSHADAVRAMSDWCAMTWGGEDGPGEPANSTVRKHIADHPGAPWVKPGKRLLRLPKTSAKTSA
jgi:hypothetical protein